MPVPPVPTVEAHRIPGEQPLHDNRYRYIAGSEHQMEMIRHEGPGVTGGSRLAYNLAKPIEKMLPV